MSSLPTVLRPARFTYRFTCLRKLPARLLSPSDAGVGTVRSLRIVPKFEISLDDVLNGRHLPPLTLKDFENYLLFVEHSSENLYFWAWMKKYDETYALYTSCKSPDNRSVVDHRTLDSGQEMLLAHELRMSYACAHATFFAESGPLQLNLTADAVTSAPLPPLPSALHDEPPSPRALAAVRTQVTDMLTSSLDTFVSAHCRNGGRRRGLFAVFVGLLFSAIGLFPLFRSFDSDPRGSRRFLSFAAFPCLWLGVTTLVAGLHGICVVIFMFGDARQLHPYEMVRPSEEDIVQLRRHGSVHSSQKAPITTSATFAPRPVENEWQDLKLNSVMTTSSAAFDIFPVDDPSGRPRIDTAAAVPVYSSAQIDVALPSSTSSSHAIAPWLSSPGPSTSTSSGFEWEIVPSNAHMLGRRDSAAREGVRGIFAPMVETLSPVVSRAQWVIVMRSALIGTVVGLVVCAVCASPFPGT